MRLATAVLLSTLAVSAVAQHPRDGEIHDSDTKAWWHTTEALSGDSMEGRDTGSPAYLRAAEYVVERFGAAGLKPAGDGGTWFQTVPMHEWSIPPASAKFSVVPDSGPPLRLGFLQEITLTPNDNPLYGTTDITQNGKPVGRLTFRGYCGKDAMADVELKIVLCFGTQRAGLPSGGERAANAKAGGALGVVNIDDPYFTIEPPRWPYAYARSVVLWPDLSGGRVRIPPGSRAPHPMLPAMRLSAEAFTRILAGTGHDAASILKTGGAKQPLESFDLPARLDVSFQITERDISSPNVLGMLRGTDPALAPEVVVASAHLDGYGFGTPVAGDALYNGALDDAAYVALLIQMADDIKAGKLPAPRRSILFAAFTGEEKGLLGSNWFVQNPTVPAARLAADINLDQLRPLFPLNILTVEALSDTTLGATAQTVATPMHIELRRDAEPERGLLRRADQFPFLRIHVPAISFIFGYDPGTDAERRYREWYQVRYHRPQDDLTQPMNFDAAAKFDTFFYNLVEAVANGPARPDFLPGSPFAAK